MKQNLKFEEKLKKSYSLRGEGKYNQAIKILKSLHKIEPKNLELIHGMIECYTEKFYVKEAKRYIKKALRIDPDDEEANYALNYIDLEKGNLAKVEKIILTGKSSGYIDWRSCISTADHCFQNSNYLKAIDYYFLSLENPNITVPKDTLVKIASCFHSLRAYGKANEILGYLSEVFPVDHKILYTLAGFAFEANDFNKALAYAQSSLKNTTDPKLMNNAQTIIAQIESAIGIPNGGVL